MTRRRPWRGPLGRRRGALTWILATLAAAGCNPGDPDPPLPAAGAAYATELAAWHRDRVAALARPDGWLSLVGLYWLAEGGQSSGSDPANDLVFPEMMPAFLGTFERQGGRVRVRLRPGVEAHVDGIPFTEGELASDADGVPTVLTVGRWRLQIVARDGRYGVRLRDPESPARTGFAGIERFPADSSWRVPARLEPYDPPRALAVPTVLETATQMPSPGALVFWRDGRSFRLDAVAEPGDTEWWLIFADATSGTATYGGGRFLYVPAPGADGTTLIDFNRAHNPPCAFTPFATCPLPPPQNRLDLAVTAGERAYGTGH
ncbi:MAG: DUF1684 domain-containing protein [Gemmatimonadota bacterium]